MSRTYVLILWATAPSDDCEMGQGNIV